MKKIVICFGLLVLLQGVLGWPNLFWDDLSGFDIGLSLIGDANTLYLDQSYDPYQHTHVKVFNYNKPTIHLKIEGNDYLGGANHIIKVYIDDVLKFYIDKWENKDPAYEEVINIESKGSIRVKAYVYEGWDESVCIESMEATIRYDNTPPVISPVGYNPGKDKLDIWDMKGSYANTNITFSFTAADNLTRIMANNMNIICRKYSANGTEPDNTIDTLSTTYTTSTVPGYNYKYDFKCSAIDNSGNPAVTDINTFYIDRIAPDKPAVNLNYKTEPLGDGYADSFKKLNALEVWWYTINEVTDYGASGVKGYNWGIAPYTTNLDSVAVTYMQQPAAGSNEIKLDITKDPQSNLFDDYNRGTVLVSAAMTIDNVNNMSAYDSVYIPIPPEPPRIEKIEVYDPTKPDENESLLPGVDVDGVPYYPVRLYFDKRIDDLFYTIEGTKYSFCDFVKIYYKSSEQANSQLTCFSEISPLNIQNSITAHSGTWYEQDSKLVLNLILKGKEYSHKTYQFRTALQYVANGGYTELSDLEASVTLPNLPAQFKLKVSRYKPDAAAAQPYMILNEDGTRFDSSYATDMYKPEISTTSDITANQSERILFELVDADNNDTVAAWQDAEGDRLVLRINTINNFTLLAEKTKGDDPLSLSYSSLYPENIHCYATVFEWPPGAAGPVAGTDTLHTIAGETGLSGFYLKFNRQAPYFTFDLRDKVYPDRQLTVGIPANQTDVSLHINKSILDPQIDKLTIWNVNPGMDNTGVMKFTNPGDISIADIIASETDTQFCMGKTGPVDYSGLGDLSDWTLLDETKSYNKYRIVAIKAEKDDLVCYSYAVIIFDGTPPAAPANTVFNITKQTVTIGWESIANAKAYLLEYQKGQGETIKIEQAASGINPPGFVIATAELGYNRYITFKMKNKNMAGSESGVTEKQILTPAILGSYAAGEPAYTAAEGHTLTWNLADGTASYYMIDKRVHGTSNWLTDGVQQAGPVIRITNLIARNEQKEAVQYDLRLRAFDRVGSYTDEADIEAVELPNAAPNTPVVVSPVGFSSGVPVFSWIGGDPEGDDVTYSIEIDNGINLTTWQTTGTTYEPAGYNFVQDVEYSYRIISQDSPPAGLHSGMAASAPVTFKVDNSIPELSIIDQPADMYTSQGHLTARITQMTSGIRSVEYRYSDEQLTHQAVVSGWDAVIPLKEGSYNVDVRVTNGAGTVKSVQSNLLRVDRSEPQITGWAVEQAGDTERYYSKDRQVRISANMADSFAGVKQLEYRWAADVSNVFGETHVVAAGGNPGQAGGIALNTTLPKELSANNLLEGKSYYLVIQAVDWAGNRSDVRFSDKPVRIDTQAPVVQIRLQGLHDYSSQYYLGSREQITGVSVVSTDAGSGVKITEYGFAELGRVETQWYADWAAAFQNGPVLADGARYYFAARVTDKAGHCTIEPGVAFMYDSSAPANVSLSEWVAGTKLVSEVVRFKTTSADGQSPVAMYRLAVGKTDDAAYVSKRITGHNAGWLESTDGSWNFALPQVDDGVYLITAQAVNAAGVVSGSGYYNITVMGEDERVIIRDPGAYQTAADSFRAALQYAGDGVCTGYEYKLTGAGLYGNDWVFAANGEVNITGLQLTNGEQYKLEGRAIVQGVGTTITTMSNGTIVDTTCAMFDAEQGLTVPAAFSKGALVIGWNAADAESGIKQVQLLLERYDAQYNRQVVGSGWINLAAVGTGSQPVLVDADGAALEWVNGERVFITLRVVNGAGLLSERAAAPVVYDNTAPPVPVVVDQGAFMRTEQASDLEADWFWTLDDPESGNAAYWWTVTQNNPAAAGALDNVVWYADDGTHKVRITDLQVTQGQKWYFAVKVVNRAGLTSIGWSNGITFDNTAPFISDVQLLQGQSVHEVHYIKDNINLTMHITAYDADSGISEYRVRYGTLDADKEFVKANEDVYADTGVDALVALKRPQGAPEDKAPQLSEGEQVWFEAEVLNGSRIKEHGYSRGVVLDRAMPELLYVNGSCTSGMLLFDWDAVTEGASPITHYALELWRVDVPGNAPVFSNYAYAGKSLEIDTVAAGLADGRYELRMEAYNGAGTASVGKISELVMLDRTAPAAGVQIRTQYNNNYVWDYLNFTVTADDELAGVNEYQYAIGTADNEAALTGGWRDVFWKTGEVDEQGVNFRTELPGGLESVIDGSTLYVSVRAKDNGGLWSGVVRSAAIYADKSAPAVPVVKTEKVYYNTAHTIGGVHVQLGDAESGVVQYMWGISATNSGNADVDWEEQPLQGWNRVVELSGLNWDGEALAHNTEWYVAVVAVNSTGQPSGIGYSDKVVIDLQAPVLTFEGTYPEAGAAVGDELVFNHGPFVVKYVVSDDTAHRSVVRFILTGADKGLDNVDTEHGLFGPNETADGLYDFSYAFDETAYDIYKLHAEVTDPAGNQLVTPIQKLRVNKPPVVRFDGEYITNPARPFTMRLIVEDPDNGDRGYTYKWQVAESANILETFDDTAAAPVIKLKHRNPQVDQESEYALEVVVTDADGKSSAVTPNVIKVVRTQEGELCTDEWWSGSHTLINTVTVPFGVSLHIAEGTVIEFEKNFNSSTGYGLVVEGALFAGAGTVFRMKNGERGDWEGIRANSIVVLTGCRIEDAVRGVTVGEGATVTLHDTVFDGNNVGVHVFKNGQVIEGCRFRDCDIWGVKEDGDASPVLRDNVFAGNNIDYYDEVRTAVTVEELNAVVGNVGNDRIGE